MLKFKWETEFKETEIGEIPKDWEVEPAITCLQFIRGIEPGSKNYKPFGKQKFIRVGDLTGQRLEDIYIDIPVSKDQICNEHEILISFDGTVGIVKKGFKGSFSSGIRKVKLKPNCENRINYDYLFYFFSATIEYQLTGFSDEKTTIAHASSAIPNLILFLPPLPEQSLIAMVLSWFDDLIENKKRQNEILEKTAMAIFKSWFVDFEPFKDEELVYNEELGKEIPKGWEVKKIGEVAKIIKGSKGKVFGDFQDGLSRYLLIESFKNGTSLYTDIKEPLIQEDDIVLVADGESSGKVLRYQSGVLGSTLLYLKITNLGLKHYIYLNLKLFEDEIMSHRTGSAIPHLDKDYLKNFILLIPPLPVLREFHSLVEPLFQKIILNQKQIMTLRKIRDTLLPLLVFGKLRVVEI